MAKDVKGVVKVEKKKILSKTILVGNIKTQRILFLLTLIRLSDKVQLIMLAQL